MKRALVVVVAAAGCASGSSTLTQQDAAVDAKKIDGGETFVDAAMIDGQVIDGQVIDAQMIDAPPDACVPAVTQLLVNPVFDLTPVGTGWTQVLVDPAYPLITGDGTLAAHSAPYKAWLGGIEAPSSTVTDILYQDVTIPAGTTQLVLTGVYEVRSSESSSETTVYDSARLDVTQPNGTPITTVRAVSNLTPTTSWTAISHTFTQSLAGQTVRIRMTSTNDFLNPTSFYFDTLSLLATHCP
jgi:hypothetical protein